MDEEVLTRDMVPAFVKLLKDHEAEVRTAIAGQIPGFCTLIPRELVLSEVLETIETLVNDTSQHVRAALGTQISGLAPILGKQEYVSRDWSQDALANQYTEPLIICCPCSFRCSRMSFRKSVFTSFLSSSW